MRARGCLPAHDMRPRLRIGNHVLQRWQLCLQIILPENMCGSPSPTGGCSGKATGDSCQLESPIQCNEGACSAARECMPVRDDAVTTCDDGNGCTTTDQCITNADGLGVCQGQGNDVNNPACVECTGSGDCMQEPPRCMQYVCSDNMCVLNLVAVASPCRPDPIPAGPVESGCVSADGACDSQGACQRSFVAAGTICNNGDECDGADDECDGSGFCRGNGTCPQLNPCAKPVCVNGRCTGGALLNNGENCTTASGAAGICDSNGECAETLLPSLEP
jgi:hypothetical protein